MATQSEKRVIGTVQIILLTGFSCLVHLLFMWLCYVKNVIIFDAALLVMNFWGVTGHPINFVYLFLFLYYMVRRQDLTTAEVVARFQGLFPNPSWLMPGRTSGHQNLVQYSLG